jgi:putative transposase
VRKTLGTPDAGVPELLMGLTEYFAFYNAERSHPSMGYRTPDEVYRTAVGGGARIVDKYNRDNAPSQAVAGIESGPRRSAASEPLPS